MTDLTQIIKKWIEIDKQITKYNEHVKNLKNNKSILESHINNYFNKTNSNQIKLSNGDSILFQNTKQVPSISLKLLNEVLEKTTDTNTANSILENIKRKRVIETKVNPVIKYKSSK